MNRYTLAVLVRNQFGVLNRLYTKCCSGFVVVISTLENNVGTSGRFTHFVTRNHNRSVCAFCYVLQSFPSSIIVDTCPAYNGPNIVKLPIKRTHTSATISTEMVNTGTNRLCLKNLRRIN